MIARIILLSSLIIGLSGCMATPRLVSNRVSDYEPPTKEERQKEKNKEQIKQQEAQPQKIIVVKPPKDDESI